MNYYNEIDPYATRWLRNLIDAGLIPHGHVDERSVEVVEPGDLTGFTQCHFFAGLGGWSCALRLAEWPDQRPIWTGSCPCQPFSVAGKGKGAADPRHLWPHFFRLIRACRPPVAMGEQVAGKAGYGWFDGVASDLEGEDYACRAVDIPACGVNAPHIRNRLYWVADTASPRCNGKVKGAESEAWHEARLLMSCEGSSGRGGLEHPTLDGRREGRAGDEVRSGRDSAAGPGCAGGLGNTACTIGRQGQSAGNLTDGQATGREESDSGSATGSADGCGVGITNGGRRTQGEQATESLGYGGSPESAGRGFWDHYKLIGPDPQGKYRRVKPGVRLLADGVPARVGKLRALGNAIVPEVAAEVIRAWMDQCS